ncbi:MAG: hypothetical protein LVR00_08105 [Rhabdochlamydiaceae bacterium]
MDTNNYADAEKEANRVLKCIQKRLANEKKILDTKYTLILLWEKHFF